MWIYKEVVNIVVESGWLVDVGDSIISPFHLKTQNSNIMIKRGAIK
jgi:hypothetical protein